MSTESSGLLLIGAFALLCLLTIWIRQNWGPVDIVITEGVPAMAGCTLLQYERGLGNVPDRWKWSCPRWWVNAQVEP